MILPNWVETNYELDKSKINLRHKDRILSVGRLVAQKNFSFLIYALKDLEIGIDIVGTGPENDLIEIQIKMIQKLCLLDNIQTKSF